MTLRTKLFFLVSFAVALAALPIVYFSRGYLMDAAVQRESEAFANTVSMVQDALGVRYLSLLVSEIESVLEAKADLRRNAGFAAEALRLESAGGTPLKQARNWQRILLSQKCRFAVYGPGGRALADDPLIRRATAEGVMDFKGRPVRPMLAAGSASSDAVLAVVRVNGAGGGRPYLLCFKPAGKGLAAVLAVPVTDTESGRKKLEAQVIRTMQDRLAGLKFHSGTSVAILDSGGAVLAGKKGGLGLDSLPQDVRERVRKGETVEDRVGEGKETVLFRLAYFKALDWYVLASAPIRSITKPAETLTRRLLLYAALLLFLILCVMLILSAQLSEPLRVLTRKITALSSLDFSREKEISTMLDG